MLRRALLLALLPLVSSAGAHAAVPAISSSDDDVTVYGASWCSACRELGHDLRQRKVPFVEIDVDQNPRAFERARQATGENAIPQTSVATDAGTRWIVGADGEAVERAYRER